MTRVDLSLSSCTGFPPFFYIKLGDLWLVPVTSVRRNAECAKKIEAKQSDSSNCQYINFNRFIRFRGSTLYYVVFAVCSDLNDSNKIPSPAWIYCRRLK
jgi:hypothetical protein